MAHRAITEQQQRADDRTASYTPTAPDATQAPARTSPDQRLHDA